VTDSFSPWQPNLFLFVEKTSFSSSVIRSVIGTRSDRMGDFRKTAERTGFDLQVFLTQSKVSLGSDRTNIISPKEKVVLVIHDGDRALASTGLGHHPDRVPRNRLYGGDRTTNQKIGGDLE